MSHQFFTRFSFNAASNKTSIDKLVLNVKDNTGPAGKIPQHRPQFYFTPGICDRQVRKVESLPIPHFSAILSIILKENKTAI